MNECKKWKGIIVKDDDSEYEIEADFLCEWIDKEENLDKIVEWGKKEKYVTSNMLWEQINKMIEADD